jgi:hypothetical protein
MMVAPWAFEVVSVSVIFATVEAVSGLSGVFVVKLGRYYTEKER